MVLLILWFFFFFMSFFLGMFYFSFRNILMKGKRGSFLGKRATGRIFRYFTSSKKREELFHVSTMFAWYIHKTGVIVVTVLLFLLHDIRFGMMKPFLFFIFALAFVLAIFILAEYVPLLVGRRYPTLFLPFISRISFPFILLSFPFSYLVLRISKIILPNSWIRRFEPFSLAKKDFLQMIQQADFAGHMNVHEKKLLESVFRFGSRVAREVMVPRIDMFGLPAETKIKEATKLIEEEGYSRIPLYQDTIDNIVGVLMYKDVIGKYREFEEKQDPKILEKPIVSLGKEVLYAPETMKISNLLLEFRKKQVHLAIIVDEYGGTEGMVTIEDILEKIVGDIEDEYDIQEEKFYELQEDGSWVIDARMSVVDVEELMGVKIPQEGDYDTVAGYIFHCTGTIPRIGFVIHQENFEIEVLDSNDRCVEKVRLRPVSLEEGGEI